MTHSPSSRSSAASWPKRLDRLLPRLGLAALVACAWQAPAQAQPVNTQLREAVALVPVPGMKDAVNGLLANLKPIPGSSGYSARTVVGGTPVMLYLYGDKNRQALLLVVNGTLTMPGVFNNSAWRRLAGTTLGDPMFSFATLDYTLQGADLPPELQQVADKSYFGAKSLSFRNGLQVAARASISGVMKTVLETGMGMPVQDFVMRAGTAFPAPTDERGQAALAASLLADMKNLASNLKDQPEFYVELQTAPGAVISGPLGMSPVSLSDATFSMNNKGTVGYQGNLVLPGGTKLVTAFQAPVAPSGAMDFAEFRLALAAQAFTLADAVQLMVAMQTPKVPGGSLVKDFNAYQPYLAQMLKPLSAIQLRNPRPVTEYRLNDPARPFPAADAFNLLAVGPLGSMEDGAGKSINGPVFRFTGAGRVFGQDLGTVNFFVGASGLRGTSNSTMNLRLGALGTQKFAMATSTEISRDRQAFTLRGTMPGRRLDISITPTLVSVSSPATCAMPFEVSTRVNFTENFDLAALLEALPGVNVDPTTIQDCVGEELKAALNWVATEGQSLGGYTAAAATSKARDIYNREKNAAREKAQAAVNEARRELEKAMNFGMSLVGETRKAKPDPMADVIYSGSVFDWDYYYDNNPDVVKSGMDLNEHWRLYGFKEGRQGSAVFSVDSYLKYNPELGPIQVFKGRRGLIEHWIEKGIDEGRRGSDQFWSKAYMARYPNLEYVYRPPRFLGKQLPDMNIKVFNYDTAIGHWLAKGMAEGLNGAP